MTVYRRRKYFDDYTILNELLEENEWMKRYTDYY